MIFGEIPEKYTSFNNSGIVLLPVPFDEGSSWLKGADKGPESVIDVSGNLELYDIETGTEVYRQGIHVDRPVKAGSPEELNEKVYSGVQRLLDKDKFVVPVGGNHSVSIGAVRAFKDKYPDLMVLQLDAHSDLRQEYLGSRFNHACVMARIREMCPVVQVGIRSMCEEERAFIDENNTFYAHDMTPASGWQQKVIDKLKGDVYITIDLDVFDPSLMPATGTPEPGGLFYYDVLHLVKLVNEKCNLRGFDVVELCPLKDNKAPDFLAAKLIYQMLSYKFS